MKEIYHITENVSFKSGGIRTVLLALNQHLNASNFNSKIITNLKEDTDAFIAFNSKKPWSYTPEIKSYLNQIIATNSIFHLHGVYTYKQYVGSKVASKNNIPYVISSHGMLEPWILNKNHFKKKMYLQLILNTILKKAAVLHAITPLEKEHLYGLTKHKNIVEIPNLIHFNTIPKHLSYDPKQDYFVFVGRIDSKKGIDLIIKAMSMLGKNNTTLKILGIENEYSLYLKNLIRELHLESKIEFLGGIFDNAKFEIIANARALIAPSFSEAIGMVNLEAAACKTPVITTYQTGLHADFGKKGGQLIQPNVNELKGAIENSLNWSTMERVDRGKTLCDFVSENYSWEKKGNLWNDLYTSI